MYMSAYFYKLWLRINDKRVVMFAIKFILFTIWTEFITCYIGLHDLLGIYIIKLVY